MACGCNDGFCSCCVNDTDTVSWTGNGTAGSCFAAVVISDPNGGLVSGVNGVTILLDPASTAPVSLGAAGLLIDCCPAAVLDSNTIDFSLPGGAISGEVILDPALTNMTTASGAGILTDLVTSDSASVSFTGEGTNASPLAAAVVVGGGGIAAFESGMMIDYAGAVAPAGWLLADGTSYATAAHPALFAAIGYVYGGAGANFNVPDASGRATYGLGSNADVNALGDNDGFALANRTPNHDHTTPGVSFTSTGTATDTTPDSQTGVNSTSQTGVAAGGTQNEWDKVAATCNNTVPNCGACGIEDIVNVLTGTTCGFTNVSVAADGHTHEFIHGHDVSVSGSQAAGVSGLKATPYIAVNKIIKT